MLLYLRYPVTQTELPVTPDMKLRPRLQTLDAGLLNYSVGIQTEYFKDIRLADVFRGNLAEQIVWQELLAQNRKELHIPTFWTREKKQSNAEVDFVYMHQGCLIPVEVKSGKDGTLRSLHQYILQSDTKLAVRIFNQQYSLLDAATPEAAGEPGTRYRLMNLPFYCVGKIREYLESAL